VGVGGVVGRQCKVGVGQWRFVDTANAMNSKGYKSTYVLHDPEGGRPLKSSCQP
jgi:hypothetical protein